MTTKSQSRFHGYMPSGGFTLPEVMVSAILLAGVSLTSTSMMLRSQTSTRGVSLRDAAYARISEDLETLRLASFRFGCEDGTEGGPVTACTGRPQFAEIAMRYKSGRISGGTPAPLTAYQQACSNNTMADLMMKNYKQPGTNTLLFTNKTLNTNNTLNLASSDVNAALATANMSINRTVALVAGDNNKLNISYSTPTGSPVNVKLNTTIVPQALGWCS